VVDVVWIGIDVAAEGPVVIVIVVVGEATAVI
jgi:hypothetical protein